jgi:hypothetical protein
VFDCRHLAAASSRDRSRRSPPRRERPHIYGTKPIIQMEAALGREFVSRIHSRRQLRRLRVGLSWHQRECRPPCRHHPEPHPGGRSAGARSAARERAPWWQPAWMKSSSDPAASRRWVGFDGNVDRRGPGCLKRTASVIFRRRASLPTTTGARRRPAAMVVDHGFGLGLTACRRRSASRGRDAYLEVASIRIAPVAWPARSRRSTAGCASSRSMSRLATMSSTAFLTFAAYTENDG